MELAQLVLKDAYDIFEEVFPQLRKNLRLHWFSCSTALKTQKRLFLLLRWK